MSGRCSDSQCGAQAAVPSLLLHVIVSGSVLRNIQLLLILNRYRTVVGVHGGDRMGHAKLRERPFIIGRQPSSYI